MYLSGEQWEVSLRQEYTVDQYTERMMEDALELMVVGVWYRLEIKLGPLGVKARRKVQELVRKVVDSESRKE